MEIAELLKQLCTASAVSGYEESFSRVLKELFEEYCDVVEIDSFFNVIGIKKGNEKTKKKIMITAHLDEIGLMVKSIDEQGFVKVAGMGGVDAKLLLAQEVTIHGKREIEGVIGAKPPHLLKPDETKKAVKLNDLSVDTGMEAEELRKYISIGDVITVRSQPSLMNGNKFSAKSVDNRCGVATLLGIMKELEKVNHDDDIYFVATCQEEVELTGAIISSYKIEPEIAVVVDACHGDMPDSPKESIFSLGKGPVVGIGPNMHKNLSKQLMQIAKEENIPSQVEVMPGDSGTEAWAVQVSRAGIPTVLVSIPVRYMHSPIETVNTTDIKNAARLVAKFITSKKQEVI